MERNESTDALAVLVSDSNDNSVMRELGKDRDPGGRVMSMSNLSIYQSMATGDGGDVLGAGGGGARRGVGGGKGGAVGVGGGARGSFEFTSPDSLPPR